MEQQQDQERPPDVTCSGGIALPRLSAMMPQPGTPLARKDDDDG